MKEAIISLVAAVFNIVAIVLKATGFPEVSQVLYEIMPEVNTIAVAILWFFGYQQRTGLGRSATTVVKDKK